MNIRPPFKIHGGKWYIKSWVIEHFPADYEQYDYIEPFVGGGSVLINKNKSLGIEVINDLDPGVVHIFRALRDDPVAFIGRLKRTKYCEETYKRMLNRDKKEHMDFAIKEFVLRRMSRGGLKNAFAWSNRNRGGQPGDVNAWETIIEQLPRIAERVKETYILNESGVNVIRAFDDEHALLYVDPPYLPETRVTTNAYEYEMTTDDHIELAEYLNKFKGKVVISGYMSQLYKRLYKGWKCHKKKIANHASQQKKKSIKIEHLWCNF